MQNKIIIFLLIVISILFIGGAVFLGQDKSDPVPKEVMGNTASSTNGISFVTSTTSTDMAPTTIDNTGGAPDVQRESTIYVGVKVPGNRFFIDLVYLTEDGFAVIYENSAEPLGEILGTSIFLPKGEYTNLPILLSRNVRDGEIFDIVLHRDNGDRIFNIKDDTLYRNEEGVGAIAHISVRALSVE